MADQVTLPLDDETREAAPMGAKVFGDYELIDEIARGGIGVVF